MRTFDQNEMADFIAIQRLQASYADIVTRRQWSELEQVFLPDATVTIDRVEGTPFALRTPAGIADRQPRACIWQSCASLVRGDDDLLRSVSTETSTSSEGTTG
jgi:hypothetical protein